MKRLLRTWLRKQVCERILDRGGKEEAFAWVYNSPLRQWRLRLWCIQRSASKKDRESLYEWLTKGGGI